MSDLAKLESKIAKLQKQKELLSRKKKIEPLLIKGLNKFGDGSLSVVLNEYKKVLTDTEYKKILSVYGDKIKNTDNNKNDSYADN